MPRVGLATLRQRGGELDDGQGRPVRRAWRGAGAALAASVDAGVEHRECRDAGYKARDIDFNEALNRATRGHNLADAAAGAVAFRVPVTPSLDGNTVELSTEQTLVAENAVQYRTTLSFLEGRIGTLKRALKGE